MKFKQSRHVMMPEKMQQIILLLLALVLLVIALPASSQADVPPTNNKLGIDNTSMVYGTTIYSNGTRYSAAAGTNARWNRFAFYWTDIQPSNSSSFAWDGNSANAWDTVINADVANGVTTQPVLMITPPWAVQNGMSTAGITAPPPRLGQKEPLPNQKLPASCTIDPKISPPRNLYSSVYTSGSDTPQSAGDTINQQNYWAWFVYQSAIHFKGRITNWEIWNEPDYQPYGGNCFGFFNGTPQDYARLLKVAYIALKRADPSNTIVMGGMSYWPDLQRYNNVWTFFPAVLDALRADPTAAGNGYYFDVTAWHWYNQPDLSYYKTLDVKNALSARGMAGKRIWINESGVPAWNNAPNTASCSQITSWYFGSATVDGQARYMIEALAYGYAAGVERIFQFQLMDDGNCEAFGLLRNDYTQRPAYAALQTASRYFVSWSSAQFIADGQVDRVVFNDTPYGRVTAIWNKGSSAVYYYLPSSAKSATTVLKSGGAGPALTMHQGVYRILLGGASDNGNSQSAGYLPGDPVIVIEAGVTGISGAISGTTVDMLGRPVGGAIVDRMTGLTSGTQLATSAGDGSFTVNVPTGINSIFASKSGYANSSAVYATARSNTTGSMMPLYLALSPESVSNGSFEQGSGSLPDQWAGQGDTGVSISTFTSYGGDRSLLLGCNPPNQGGNTSIYHNSLAYQIVNVPAGVTNPVLAFNYRMPYTAGPYAWLEVFVDTPNGRTFLFSDQPTSWSPGLHTATDGSGGVAGWVHKAVSLAALPEVPGNSISVVFNFVRRDDVRTASAPCFGPIAYLDDVSLSSAGSASQSKASSPAYANGPITVSWNPLTGLPGTMTYDVQYRIGNGGWTDWLLNTTATSASFTTGLADGARYGFRVRAHSEYYVSQYAAGGDSSTLYDTAAPTGFTAAALSNSGTPANSCAIMKIAVTPPSSDPVPADGEASGLLNYRYEVQQSGNWRTFLVSSVAAALFNASPGQSYSFRVTASDRAGNTQQSTTGTILAGSDRCGFSVQSFPEVMRNAGAGW